MKKIVFVSFFILSVCSVDAMLSKFAKNQPPELMEGSSSENDDEGDSASVVENGFALNAEQLQAHVMQFIKESSSQDITFKAKAFELTPVGTFYIRGRSSCYENEGLGWINPESAQLAVTLGLAYKREGVLPCGHRPIPASIVFYEPVIELIKRVLVLNR